MVDVVLGDQAVGQGVHIVDGGENVVYDDVLGNQLVGMEAALVNELLTLVLAQQVLKNIEADTLLDAALGLGVKVHIAAHVAHTVGENADGGAVVGTDGDLGYTDGVQLPALLAGENMALVKEDLAGGGVRHGQGQLAVPGNGPKGELLIELIAAHDAQIVAPGIKEEVIEQGLGRV